MNKTPYQCQCRDCQAGAEREIVQEHRLINQLIVELNEKQRRQFVGLLAKQQGYGGIGRLAEITGLHRATITRGQSELANAVGDDDRIRRPGGGRHLIEKKSLDC